MEMLLYQSTQFRDVKKILDRAHGFAGLLTAGGIEASRLDVPFICDQKVLSRYDDACSDVRRILTMQLGLELPKGFSIPLEAEDLAVFFSQQCGLRQMQDYLTRKRARTQADIQTWLRDRPWDTHPVTGAQAAAQNFVFDAQTGRIGTDGCFNAGTVLELPSSVDGVRVRRLASYAMVSYTYLDTLILPDSIETVEPYAFYDKVHLRSTNLPRGLSVIPEGMFSRCIGLTGIVIPDSVREIHDEAFYQCSNLDTVVIPDGVERIGRCAFLNARRVIYHGSAKGFPWGATRGN